MARYTGPKWKQSRREGTDLFFRPGSKYQKNARIDQPPGVHGPKKYRSKASDYALQLREKQKLKKIYGLLERQFLTYIKKAIKARGQTGNLLFNLLEMRLDNTIYRLGLTATRPQARQLVTHGHVLVNDQKITIPSYQLKPNDVLSLSQKANKFNLVLKSLEADYPVSPWLKRKATVGKVTRLPKREEIDTQVQEQLIIEYYSR